MSNPNYISGRNFEYERMKVWRERKYHVVRSSGSHGLWDLCAVSTTNPTYPVLLIQLKRVGNEAEAKRMIKEFRAHPPLLPSSHYHFLLEVKVKGSRDVVSVEV